MAYHLKNAKSYRSDNRKVALSQYQVMDAMRPLIHLWINLPENSPFMEAVELGLQLLGGASANIAKMRRFSM
jgi:hypothetical protein